MIYPPCPPQPHVRQIVDLRGAVPPRALAFADRDQREEFLQRREAARATQQSRYAVSLGCQVRLPDGSWLPELAPVDPSQFDAGSLRELLRGGHIVERYDIAEQPKSAGDARRGSSR